MELLKALGTTVPPLLVLLALVLVGMALFVWPPTRRFARRWLLLVTGTYAVFGLPVVANAIARWLPAVPTPRVVRPVTTLLLFDGDNRRARLRVTLDILTKDNPATVWVLGSGWFIDELELAGHRPDRFHHETVTTNTREQVDWVAAFIRNTAGARPVIVVSRLQAPRVAALARAAKIDVNLAISPIDDEPPVAGWRTWMPSYVALRASRDAIYEHAAFRYYRWKGWIG